MTKKWRNIKEQGIRAFFLLMGISTIVILMGIFLMLVWKGVKTFGEVSVREFLFGTQWNPTAYTTPSYGIVAMVLGTLMVTLGAMLIAVPIGIGSAAYIAEVASPKTREIVKPTIEILASIPSVAIGFIGIVLIGPLIAKFFGLTNGLNAINGSILLAIMALPTIISISEDAIRAVPKDYREASYALGAHRSTTLLYVTLPAAFSGIVVAIMLGIGRAIGETMTVLMATGNALAIPHGFSESVRTMTATVAIELGEVPYGTTHYYGLFAIGGMLFVISFVVNWIAEFVTYRRKRMRT